jgi:hypothetical protein
VGNYSAIWCSWKAGVVTIDTIFDTRICRPFSVKRWLLYAATAINPQILTMRHKNKRSLSHARPEARTERQDLQLSTHFSIGWHTALAQVPRLGSSAYAAPQLVLPLSRDTPTTRPHKMMQRRLHSTLSTHKLLFNHSTSTKRYVTMALRPLIHGGTYLGGRHMGWRSKRPTQPTARSARFVFRVRSHSLRGMLTYFPQLGNISSG